MARGSSLTRQLQLMHLLAQRRVVGVPELARELGANVRTLYRDLGVLEAVGVPLVRESSGRTARWRVVDGYRPHLSVSLSPPEQLSLALGSKLLAGLDGPLGQAPASVVAKIERALPGPMAERGRALAESVSASLGGARAYRERAEILALLTDSIGRRRTVRLSHRGLGAGAPSERLVDPLHLHLQAGAFYLIGFCRRRGALRTFLLDRIDSTSPTGTSFMRRPGFDASKLLHGAFGPWEGRSRVIALRFGPVAARRVAETRMHPTQRAQLRSDGGLDLSLRMPICPALVSWVLGFGSEVAVVGPAALADQVRKEHGKAATDPGSIEQKPFERAPAARAASGA